ncbi:glycosyltransferase family 4 protein [Acetobacter orleanensis]|uniref:Glycosyl transferase n=1 Tax=Acetobacter orleanensis TaxID=104099 RepID=A0A4Y3TN43_9PROT|nr:glycosyltransferase family 4 protein [Acetobacter orleanensis]KXV62600.1 glycosyl transferase [Acetobacter orleanensis]PCD79952.1 glycosyl transferase [Acetobacter orleanensis]GAN68258.1 glycosyl transferase [Acetobacter orleanensis JCM 7639]GBR31224.1 glycosyltransferase [Acetobacter orleanensis NRIC 0473]GEB82849.1 glycosyl transferase [Acetobacter orleanensis]
MTITPPSPVILQILPALEQGGVERGTLEMADAITQAGGTALVMSAGGRLVPSLERLGARHHALPGCGSKNPFSILRNAGTLARFIQQNKVALVHARSRAPAWVARLACTRTGTPFVTTWHGVHANNFPGKKRYNAVLAAGDRVIAISQHIGQRLAQEYHVGPDRLRVIPRGADITQFSPEAVSGQRVHRLSESWDVPAGVPVILMPGRLTEWKGQRFLLEALARVKHVAPMTPWVCVFVGSCPPGNAYAESLVAHARALGLTDQVRFAGHCQDMPAAMALATVVVIPSLRPEPFGRVVVEAQAMSRPVIVTAHGAALETVQHGMTGLSIPPGDIQALADAMTSVLLAPPDALHTMGEAARATVLARYTTHAMQQATLHVYDELLGTELHKNAPTPFQDMTSAG